MPHLVSESGALRLALELVQRETSRPGEEAQSRRVLTTAAVEWLDRSDGEWWPFVRLPPLRIDADAAEALLSGLRDVLQGNAPGFAWQSGEAAVIGLQLGATDRGALVEVGVDLAPFLADVAGTSAGPAGELALFRFSASSADLVRFAGALEEQIRDLASR